MARKTVNSEQQASGIFYFQKGNSSNAASTVTQLSIKNLPHLLFHKNSHRRLPRPVRNASRSMETLSMASQTRTTPREARTGAGANAYKGPRRLPDEVFDDRCEEFEVPVGSARPNPR